MTIFEQKKQRFLEFIERNSFHEKIYRKTIFGELVKEVHFDDSKPNLLYRDSVEKEFLRLFGDEEKHNG